MSVSISAGPLRLAISILLAGAAVTVAEAASGTSGDDIKMYPAAEPGYKRYVITLSPKKNEAVNYKVELLPYTVLQKADTCNSMHASGKYEEKTVEGWGYNYFVVTTPGTVASTMMACPDQRTAVREVLVNTGLPLITYNSKLPIVVYTPDNVGLKYRIWKGDGAPAGVKSR